MFDRLNRVFQQGKPEPRLREPTLETLLPGDVVSLWDGPDAVVLGALECREELNRRVTRWRWNVLDEGRLLEVAPDGNVLYERSAVLYQSSAEFETLTSDPEQGGVLKAFEARVRQGTAARQPSLFEYDGRVYRVVSTGIFEARPAGAPSWSEDAYPNVEVWRDINPTHAGDNVYFELEPTEDVPEREPGSIVLGIWTSHIALLFGRPLTPSDIQSIYPRAEQEDRSR